MREEEWNVREWEEDEEEEEVGIPEKEELRSGGEGEKGGDGPGKAALAVIDRSTVYKYILLMVV